MATGHAVDQTTFLKVANRVYSKLAAAVTSGATTWTVTSGDGGDFPDTYPYILTCEDERVLVTNRVGDALTVQRGYDGTTAAIHPNKAYVALNIVARAVSDLNAAVNTIEQALQDGMQYLKIYGAADNLLDFAGGTVNAGGAEIRLSNYAVIQNTTAGTLKLQTTASGYVSISEGQMVLKADYVDLDLTALRFIGSGANVDGHVVFRDNIDIGRSGAAVTVQIYGGTIDVRGTLYVETTFRIGDSYPFSDSSGVLTLQNIDAIDATTEGVIEAAIDTLANLTSVQGHTLTLVGDLVTAGGAYNLTLTMSAATNVTLPTTGTLATLAGAETFTQKVSYNGLVITADTGAITSGSWTATVISPVYGGTGIANNVASTITISGAYGLTLTVSNTTSLTLPTTGTLATLAGTEELDNKTLDSSVAKGTWTASGTWTIPAVTLGGTVTGNNQNIGNLAKISFGNISIPNDWGVQGQYIFTDPSAHSGSFHVEGIGAATTGDPGAGIYIVGSFQAARLNTTNTQNWSEPKAMQAMMARVHIPAGVSGGTIAGGIAVRAYATVESITLTNYYGIYLDNPTGSGTIINTYGIYFESLTKGSTLNFEIVAAGSIRIATSGDTDDYFTLSTISDVPTITATGATHLGFGSSIVISNKIATNGQTLLAQAGNLFNVAVTSSGASNYAVGNVFYGIITGAEDDTNYLTGVRIAHQIITQNSADDVVGVISQLRLEEPVITLQGSTTATIAATLHILNAPTEGVANYAIYVTTGESYLPIVSTSTNMKTPIIYGYNSTYLRIGDAATTSHSLASEDDLMVTGKLEVDGIIYFDNYLTTSSYIELTEMTAPGAGAANTARIYAVVGGDTLTDLAAVFQDGTVDIFAQEATEPDSPIFEFPDNTELKTFMRKPDRRTIQFVSVFPDGREFVMREIRYPIDRW